jgi:hypothetical protein
MSGSSIPSIGIARCAGVVRILVCLTTCTGIRWPLEDLRLTLAIGEPAPTAPRHHSELEP